MSLKTAPTIKELTQTYGASNLVFVMDVDCFDEVGVMMGAMIGVGLVSAGENTRRVPLMVRERHYALSENHKIELQGLDEQDFTIPFQCLHIRDFESMIRAGNVNIYVDTPDGYMPVYQVIKECLTPKEAETIRRVESNVFLRTLHHLMES